MARWEEKLGEGGCTEVAGRPAPKWVALCLLYREGFWECCVSELRVRECGVCERVRVCGRQRQYCKSLTVDLSSRIVLFTSFI